MGPSLIAHATDLTVPVIEAVAGRQLDPSEVLTVSTVRAGWSIEAAWLDLRRGSWECGAPR
jgi:hypothetical protein